MSSRPSIDSLDEIRQIFIKAAVDGDLTIEKMLRFPEGTTILLNRSYLESLITKLVEEAESKARIDELDGIEQAYIWKSIVTFEGFKKWKANRLNQLKANRKEEE